MSWPYIITAAIVKPLDPLGVNKLSWSSKCPTVLPVLWHVFSLRDFFHIIYIDLYCQERFSYLCLWWCWKIVVLSLNFETVKNLNLVIKRFIELTKLEYWTLTQTFMCLHLYTILIYFNRLRWFLNSNLNITLNYLLEKRQYIVETQIHTSSNCRICFWFLVG